ncbi:uncharacterized protein IUM83_09213 [Phytophthora cinnamomi]|uniref:uncharacterized protein n=1 Tax=Phytophthora cinnamomi TaxID=4785 RepID=UPI00355A6DD2|nr:hypothetical protein IUM83_09213 [Phytophthora cinnamomi]
MPSFRVDTDGDVEMTIPPPVYELISAPELAAWDQESLVKWLRERRRYREAIEERCRISQEPVDSVLRSVRASVKPKLLDYLARYVFRQDQDALGDQEIMNKITERVAEVMNGHIPDIFGFFKSHLKMDLKEQDVEARVVKYFVDFDQLIEEHGFASMLAAGSKDRSDYRDRMKNRCKLIIENVSPAMLKTEIKRLVSLQHREAKTDDIALHQLILARAKMQQRYHLMDREEKAERKPSVKPDGGRAAPKTDAKRVEPKPDNTKTAGSKPNAGSSGKSHLPPRDGCLYCKGPHLVRVCPTATEEQKQQCYQRLRESKIAKVKAARVRHTPGHHQVVINDVVELPYRPDTGSEVNVLPASAIRDLEACGSPVATVEMEMPVFLERVGGDLLACKKCCDVSIMLGTAAGPVHLRKVHCVIVEDDEEEFLLGNPTLLSLGIDVDRQMEQLASGGALNGDDGDDIRGDPDIGHDVEDETTEFVNDLIRKAGESGFPEDLMAPLRRIVMDYKDVWRSRLGDDEPARVAPYRVTLKEGSQPIRFAGLVRSFQYRRLAVKNFGSPPIFVDLTA